MHKKLIKKYKTRIQKKKKTIVEVKKEGRKDEWMEEWIRIYCCSFFLKIYFGHTN